MLKGGSTVNMNNDGEVYDVFIQHLDDFAMFLVDDDGCVVTWNIGAERLFGYTPGEILRQPITCFYTADDITAGVVDQELRDARANGKASDDRWLVRKNGTRVWVSGVTVAFEVRGARVFGKVIRDQTDTRRNAERLVTLNRELVSSVKKMEESQQQLMEKVLEMERFEEAVVGRELKMIELEKQVKQLRQTMEHKVEGSGL
jgi:PAS domain S-box-containing protein